MSQGTFKTFRDLEVWQAARGLRQRIYTLIQKLPESERFNLVSQMRRAALSLTNNIAEGHGRYGYQENIQFLRQARGSLEELLDDLTLCADEKYVPVVELKEFEQEIGRVRALLNAYIRHLKERKEASASTLRETSAAFEIDDGDAF
ncbi:MAG TPA: four helix bundle protein [Verrucomicrobiae bacterium]|nr:four helix bundle protein [Verrucomicrobiae bacterium]